MLQLGHTIHQKKNLLSEFLLHLVIRHDRILQHVMQQACRDGLLVQLQFRQNDCHTERMNNIRLSRLAHLTLVGVVRHLIRLLDQRNIPGWMVFADACDQILIQILRTGKLFD